MKLVSRETDCQRSGFLFSGARDSNLTPVITHLETGNRQYVWLTVKRHCREKPECAGDRGPWPGSRSQAKAGKLPHWSLNSEYTWLST